MNNKEKLWHLMYVIIALTLFYFGLRDLYRRHNPPPEIHPYFTDIYQGVNK